MKIIITESQYKLLIENYSKKVIDVLTKKFQTEKPNLELNIINSYISRFYDIKNSPNVVEKDIMKYTWKELEKVVDMNQPKKGRINNTIEVSDSNVVYNKNGIVVKYANTEKACVKYGTGYNFCISTRSGSNMANSYMFGESWSIYFIINNKKSNEKYSKNDYEYFMDPSHLLVVMVRKEMDGGESEYEYQVTTADNDGEETYSEWENIAEYFDLPMELKNIIIPRDADSTERNLYILKNAYRKMIFSSMHNIFGGTSLSLDPKGDLPVYLPDKLKFGNNHKDLFQIIDKILNGTLPLKKYIRQYSWVIDDDFNEDNTSIGEVRYDNISLEDWKEYHVSTFDATTFDVIIEDWSLTKKQRQYLNDIKELTLNYLNARSNIVLTH